MDYSIKLNERSGIVEATVHRVCDPKTIADYERALLALAKRARDEIGHLRLLVDSAKVGPLPPESVERLMLLEDKLVRPEDRVAIIVGSSVAKLQLTTPSRHPQVKRFLSMNAARIRLTAHDSGGALARRQAA